MLCIPDIIVCRHLRNCFVSFDGTLRGENAAQTNPAAVGQSEQELTHGEAEGGTEDGGGVTGIGISKQMQARIHTWMKNESGSSKNSEAEIGSVNKIASSWLVLNRNWDQ